jgi:hypothetical protein
MDFIYMGFRCVRSNSSCVNECFYSRVNRLIDPSMLEDLLDRSPKSYYQAHIYKS